MIPDRLVTTYLEMTDPAQHRRTPLPAAATVHRMGWPDVAFYRFLYKEVGAAWRWRDRLVLGDDAVHALLTAPGTTVDVLYVDGSPAGFIELERTIRTVGHDVEIAYFGLRSAFFGYGLGKGLLSYGVDRAWRGGARRIWLHTCNLDGPHALANYQARGFVVTQVTEEPMPQLYRD